MKTCYAIIELRSFYDGETKISLVVDDTGSQYFSFSSRDGARAWIRKLADQKHYHRDNYITRSTYAVTEVGSENFYDAYKCTWGASPERYLLGIKAVYKRFRGRMSTTTSSFCDRWTSKHKK